MTGYASRVARGELSVASRLYSTARVMQRLGKLDDTVDRSPGTGREAVHPPYYGTWLEGST